MSVVCNRNERNRGVVVATFMQRPYLSIMRTLAPDQRVKICFPDASGRSPSLSADNWLADYQAMDPKDRPPRRTYTIRALRTADREVDVDFVLHGVNGQASRWALSAACGQSGRLVALAAVIRRESSSVSE